MSDLASQDPTIRSAGVIKGTGSEYGQGGGNAMEHVINSLLLNLPKGVASGTKTAKGINDLLGGLPEKLIESYGGKQKLLAALNKPNVTADIIGTMAPSLTPWGRLATKLGGPIGTAGKIMSSIPGQAALGAVTQGLSAANVGDETPGYAAGLGAIGGAGGALLGKGLGAVLGKAKADPMAAMSELEKAAARANLGVTTGLGKRPLKQFYNKEIAHGGAEAVRDELAAIGKEINANKLTDPENLAAYKAATQNMWKPVDNFVTANKFTPMSVANDILSSPAVADYLDPAKMAQKMSGGDKIFGSLMDRASGIVRAPDGSVQSLSPIPFGDVRAFLAQARDGAYNAAQHAFSGGASDVLAKQNNLDLARALDEARDVYTNKAMEGALGDVGPAAELKKKLMFRFKVEKIGEMSEAAQATDLGSARYSTGSESAFRLNPWAIGKNLAAKASAGLTNKLGNAMVGGVTGKVAQSGIGTPGTLANIAGRGGLAMLPGGVNAPARLGQLGAQIGQMGISPQLAQPVSGPPGTPPIQPPSGPTYSGLPGSIAPAGAQKDKFGIAPVAVQEPGAVNSPEARAVNAKYGYGNSSMDDAIMEGVNRLFDSTYRARFKDNPKLEAEWRERFLKGALDHLHSMPGRELDTNLASRVLFPGDAEKQAAFSKAAQDNFRMVQILEKGLAGGGPIGAISRYVSPDKAQAYDALKQLMLANGASEKGFNEVMRTVAPAQSKAKALRDLMAAGTNARGWLLYNNAIGGKR